MNSLDVINMSLRNLWKRKLRTFLTVFGVIIGTTAIVTMMSLGIGINRIFEAQVNEMGDLTTITIRRPWDYWQTDSSGNSTFVSSADRPQLNAETVDMINRMDGVIISTGILEMWLRFAIGRYYMETSVIGIEPAAMELLGYTVEDGSLLTVDSSHGNQMEMVFGSNTLHNWRRGNDWRTPTESKDVMSERITFHFRWDFTERGSDARPYIANVRGTLQMQEGFDAWTTNNSVFMNINDVTRLRDDQRRFQASQQGSRNNETSTGYDIIYVKCANIQVVSNILEQLREKGFDANNPADFVNEMRSFSRTLQLLLGAIGGVSLFVAAIGIANTMVMSIYERTKEIGIMKVIGASIKDIKKLFLLEAALIGLFGGIFGVALSFGASYVINNVGIDALGSMFMGQGDTTEISFIPIWLCIAALAFSSTIGLISGYFPARRAMKLSALTAIRTE